MFTLLGQWIGRRPGVVVGIWIVALAAAATWMFTTGPAPPPNIGSFLPADTPHNQAMRFVQKAFPQMAARSQIVLVAHRSDGLSPDDIAWLGTVAERMADVTHGPVLSPTLPFLNQRLVSDDGRVAMAVANLPSNFISATTIEAVTRVEKLLDADRPEGLRVELTGTAGIGHDYALATERAVSKTTWVTVLAVLVILILMYRSPVGGFVPLLSIGASAFLAMSLLEVLARVGLPVGDIERVFAVVLLFGAGVNYAFFWIARYREALADQLAASEEVAFHAAAVTASRRTGPAVLASAATTICGLTTMVVAQLVPSRNAGMVLAPVLTISLLAALTLAPALARLMGRALFWPVGLSPTATFGQRTFWPAMARVVSRRPGVVLLGGLIALGSAALYALNVSPRYDALSELPHGSSSERGFEILERHFPPGELYGTQMCLRFESALPSDERIEEISAALVAHLTALEGVTNVHAPHRPLGTTHRPAGAWLNRLLVQAARPYFVSDELAALRFEVLIAHPPFSKEAMDLIDRVQAETRRFVAELEGIDRPPEVLAAGLTPYIRDVQQASRGDLLRVMVLASLVIGSIVMMLVRDLALALFMLMSTWLTYGATLTFSHLFFTHVLGEGGLDWKVHLIVFVLVVAVGQDYNIFLVSRLLEELRCGDAREATRRAIVRTGSVISSCGIIMAATLGSLWAGELLLLRQVGFALALGVLIDTFVGRPLLVPGFFLLSGRADRFLRRRARAPMRLGGRQAEPADVSERS